MFNFNILGKKHIFLKCTLFDFKFLTQQTVHRVLYPLNYNVTAICSHLWWVEMRNILSRLKYLKTWFPGSDTAWEDGITLIGKSVVGCVFESFEPQSTFSSLSGLGCLRMWSVFFSDHLMPWLPWNVYSNWNYKPKKLSLVYGVFCHGVLSVQQKKKLIQYLSYFSSFKTLFIQLYYSFCVLK